MDSNFSMNPNFGMDSLDYSEPIEIDFETTQFGTHRANSPMYTMNKFEARSFAEMLQPNFRSIKVEPDNPNINVARGLRSAWKGDPIDKKPHYQEQDVQDYLNLFYAAEPRADPTPRNSDMEFSTPWRFAVYEMWNRLFVDVMKFLPDAAPDVGHFHVPSHNILPITQSFHKTFSTDVLIVPAYLKPGIKITMSDESKNWSQPTRAWGSFSSEDHYDIWFLKKGFQVKFEVEGEKEDQEGLKAVLVYGVVCNESHRDLLPYAEQQRAAFSSAARARAGLSSNRKY